jgi:hypothetical protein
MDPALKQVFHIGGRLAAGFATHRMLSRRGASRAKRIVGTIAAMAAAGVALNIALERSATTEFLPR